MSQLAPIEDSNQSTSCNNVRFAEMDGYTEDYQTKDGSITRVLYCRWLERIQFVEDMLGTCGHCSGGSQTDNCDPQADANRPWLHCVECRLMKGAGAPSGSGGPIVYEDLVNSQEGYAIFQCTFRSLEYNVGQGGPLEVYIIKRRSYATETLTVHECHYKWLGGGDISSRRGIHQMLQEVTYTKVMFPDPLPEASINQFVNSKNNSDIDQYDQYTLLMMAPEVRWYYDAGGNRCWDMGIKWLQRQGPDDADWRKLFKTGSGWTQTVPDIFQSKTHQNLFIPCSS